MGSVASVFERLGVKVVAGGSGERETEEEAYLLVEEDRDVTPLCSRQLPKRGGPAGVRLQPSLA